MITEFKSVLFATCPFLRASLSFFGVGSSVFSSAAKNIESINAPAVLFPQAAVAAPQNRGAGLLFHLAPAAKNIVSIRIPNIVSNMRSPQFPLLCRKYLKQFFQLERDAFYYRHHHTDYCRD